MPLGPTAAEYLAVEREVRAVIADVITGRCPAEIAVARVVTAVLVGPDEAAPAERPAERNARINASATAIMSELENQGRGRSAAAIAARRLATDAKNPAEIEMLSQRFRRLRRTRKLSERRSLPAC